ncbi:hypothetical protein [Sphingobacterium endophyticum]|nr:hypothetical protein [Sphingobacterium endophyticum]
MPEEHQGNLCVPLQPDGPGQRAGGDQERIYGYDLIGRAET